MAKKDAKPAAKKPTPPKPGANKGGAKPAPSFAVSSKIKKFTKEKTGMNTPGDLGEILTKHIKQVMVRASEVAKADGRKTILSRDVEEACNPATQVVNDVEETETVEVDESEETEDEE